MTGPCRQPRIPIPAAQWSLQVITTRSDITSISDHGIIVACMAVLKESGMTEEQAVPIYSRLLEHHGLTAENISANLSEALVHLPTEGVARSHLVEVCPELEGVI